MRQRVSYFNISNRLKAKTRSRKHPSLPCSMISSAPVVSVPSVTAIRPSSSMVPPISRAMMAVSSTITSTTTTSFSVLISRRRYRFFHLNFILLIFFVVELRHRILFFSSCLGVENKPHGTVLPTRRPSHRRVTRPR